VAQSLLSKLMLAEKMRRLFVMFLALALTAGLAAHSVPTGNHLGKPSVMAAMSMDATSMDATSDATSMDTTADMPMPCKDGGCAGDEKGLMPAACAAFCGSVAASPVVPTVFDAVPIATLWPPKSTALTGYAGPPDPYPPRPIRMS
jgi:hypothetical protein